MPLFIHQSNPFNPAIREQVRLFADYTIWEYLQEKYPGFVEFEAPTICILNGQPVMRADWKSTVVRGEDVVAFITAPAFGADWLMYLLFVLIGAAVGLLIPKPNFQQNQADSVYTIRGQQNKLKLGAPVEVAYGKVRLWPSYGAVPYNRYVGNDQYQYALFCLGQGRYDIHSIQIEETLISNFADVEYAVYEPGEPVTLFDDNVITSNDVSNVNLIGTNEAGWAWIGPFAASGPGTTPTKLELDFVLPMGLYSTSSSGKVKSATITVEYQYRMIDNAGAPIGDWFIGTPLSWTMSTATPQRFTIPIIAAGPHRWEVRCRRSNTKDLSTSAANLVQWGALRAFLPSVKNYGDKTMLAVRMRATNQLNDQSAFRFNVWATRKIPTYENGAWTEPVPTRSLVWAFCDVIRAKYGGQCADEVLPLEELVELNATLVSQGRNFDFIFDQSIGVWEALQFIARHARAVPVLEMSQIRIVQDLDQEIPGAVFNDFNIVKGSFSWNITLPKDNDYDGVLVTYTNPADFLASTVECLVGNDIGDNLEELKLPGITSKTWAYREGMYYREVKKKLRQTIQFTTGREGHLPRFGTMIGVNHRLGSWVRSGIVTGVDVTGTVLQLSSSVAFTAPTHCIGFKTRLGGTSDPITCTAGTHDKEVVLSEPLPESVTSSSDPVAEPPLFFFGVPDLWARKCVVSRYVPNNDGTVTVHALLYNPEIFGNDGAMPPDVDDGEVPPKPTVPGMDCASVSVGFMFGDNEHIGTVSWAPVIGAKMYQVRLSIDNGVSWMDKGTTTMTSMKFTSFVDPLASGPAIISVRPVGVGAGDWCDHNFTVPEPKMPWDQLPGSEAGVYCDFVNLIENMPGGLEFKSISGTATMNGYREFVHPSRPTRNVPPKVFKYIYSTSPFTVEYYKGYDWGYDCNYSHVADFFSNSANASGHYDYATNQFVGGFGSTITNSQCFGAWTPPGPGSESQLASAPNGTDWVVHQSGVSASLAITLNGCAGCGGSNLDSYRMGNLASNGPLMLSTELTEKEAAEYDEVNHSWSSWSGYGAESMCEERGQEDYQFTYQRVSVRGNWTNGLPFWRYVLEIQMEWSLLDPIDSLYRSWQDGEVLSFVLEAADLNGNMSIPEFGLKFEPGKSYRVKSWSITMGC